MGQGCNVLCRDVGSLLGNTRNCQAPCITGQKNALQIAEHLRYFGTLAYISIKQGVSANKACLLHLAKARLSGLQSFS